MTVDVAADVATDAAGNDNTAAVQVSSTYTAPVIDNTAPRVTSIARQTPASSPTNADSLTWRVTFDEDVKNVDAMDFEVSGTTATPTAVSEVTASTVYDVTVSGGNLADRNAPVTLAFAAGQNIVDTADNALSNTTPTGATDNDYVVDNTKPTVTITGVPMTSTAAFTATITFLEPVNGFAVGDITVGNGTASSFTGSDGDTAFTALISPTADGAVTVDVAADVATDAAGNDNTAAVQVSSTYTAPVIDNTAPRVTSIARQTPASSPTNADSLTWRVTFDEDVANVDTMDFEVSGTTATPTAVSEVTASTVYDVTVSGGNLAALDAPVTLTFAAGQDIADTADNALSNTTPTGTNDNDYAVDNTKPAVTITGVPMTSTAAFTATITFLESVNGFVVGDITVGNGTASSFTGSDGDTAFTALISPTADGAVTVDVAADVATDAAGNDNTAAVQVSSTYTAPVIDNTAPRVTSIARQTPASSPTNADSLTWRVTFDEDVENVDATDFAVTGTSATPTAVSEVTASTVYDVTVSGGNLADRNAPVTLAFAAGRNIVDTADNALSNTTPTGTNDNDYAVDNTKPAVTITGVPMTSTAAFTAAITFLESVNGFVVGDITVGNGTASSFTGSDGDTAFTALISPTADGAVTVDVAADVATDAAGNGNTAAVQASSTYTAPLVDNTAPRVTSIAISPEPPRASEEHGPFYTKEAFLAVPDGAVHGPGATLTFTLTFSRDVTVTPDPDSRAQPELVLDVFGRERRARYTGGSGTQELTFVWTVEKGDNDPDGLEVQQIALNGAIIRDSQDRDTEPETFPSARHKAYRVRGGLHAMWLVVTGSAREGAPFTVKVQRDGGFDELAHAIVRMTDSGMASPAPGEESAQNHGVRLMSFPFDADPEQGEDSRISVQTVTPPGDGVADARTLTLKLFATDIVVDSKINWYVTGDPGEATVPVADTGLAGGNPDAPSLGVWDAWTQEPTQEQWDRGTRFPLLFDVTVPWPNVLRPRGEATVTVQYETNNGTAVAGSDYVATSGTLTFLPGETRKTVEIEVMADRHDEGEETLTLVLSDATGAALERAEAVGTIRNNGPIPKAWIARFGRTVAEQMLEVVEGRMRAAPAPGVEMALAGEQIGVGSESPGSGSGAGGAGGAGGSEAERDAQRLTDWLNSETGDEAQDQSRAVTPRDLLTGSSFTLTEETPGKELVSFWGRGAVTSFDGREGDLTLDGEVATGMLGADWTRGRWTTGLILSHSSSEGSYSDGSGSPGSRPGAGGMGGSVEATLTGLFPWTRHALSDQLEAWGMAGYGAGELTVTPKKPGTDESGAVIRADLDLRMAVVGLRGTLLGGGSEGLTLTGKTDAMMVQTASGQGRGADGGNLEAARATVTRLRLGVEASRPILFNGEAGGGTTLTPSLEVGVRHDGGDAETGFGLDLGIGLALGDPERGLQAEMRARGLLAHESEGFRDLGFSGTFAWEGKPGSDLGAKLGLTQTVGGSSSGGADALLSRTTLDGLAANPGSGSPGSASGAGGASDSDVGDDELTNRRLELKFGYGLPAFGGRFTWTPEAWIGLSDTGRDYSLGWRLVRGGSGEGGGSFEISFEARRSESANDDTQPVHEVGSRFTARF